MPNENTKDEESPKRCGAQHPEYKNVTCVKWGKCMYDSHIGEIQKRNGEVVYIRFGEAAGGMPYYG